jgi:hypothetical protein
MGSQKAEEATMEAEEITVEETDTEVIHQNLSETLITLILARYDKSKGKSEKDTFQRKELTEDEKRMKVEASMLKDKLAERNKLKNTIELKLKLELNRITLDNYDSVKKVIFGKHELA